LEEKSGFFVLIIVIAFLSLTLALLAGYVFFFSGGDSESANEVGRSTKVAIPADEELATFPLFEGAKIFNLKMFRKNRKTPIPYMSLSKCRD
jgi:flagellar basal body-associated protein FliL